MSERQSFSIICDDLDATRRVGVLIGKALVPGICIALQGTLGAGKTNLVQAIASALGVERKSVTSPTFTMIQVYSGRLQLVHIDAYRIADEDEFFELGIDEYLEDDSVVAMEWAEKFQSLLPDERLDIAMDILGETKRQITFSWPQNAGRLADVAHSLQTDLAAAGFSNVS